MTPKKPQRQSTGVEAAQLPEHIKHAAPAIESLPETVSQFSEAGLAGILDIALEAIIAVDRNQRILFFNKSAGQLFGYTPAEVTGKALDILIPERFIAAHRRHIETFAGSADTARLMGERAEITGRRKDGTEFPAEASISKATLGGRQIFAVVLRDITARKEAEWSKEQLISYLNALDGAAQAIAAELSLEQVLQKIAEVAQNLIGVKYAALGVHDGQGRFSRFITAGVSPAAYAKIGAPPVGLGLLAPLLQRGESIIVDNISHNPNATGFPRHHPAMKTLLGVPVFAKGQLIGALYLADKKNDTPFNQTDQQVIERLALHAAIAIENARVYEQTQRLAILEERERFARDLHDGIIQSIYAVGLVLDQAKDDISPANQTIRQQIDLSLKNLAGVIQDLRNYIFDLRPQALTHQGLKARLEGLIKEVTANTLLPIHAEISPDINAHLNDWQASNLFLICHEALSNAVRHASPAHITISLTCRNNTVTLIVEDDGIGFEPPRHISHGHHGLANIKARTTQLGATLQLDSGARQGTRLQVSLKCGPQPE